VIGDVGDEGQGWPQANGVRKGRRGHVDADDAGDGFDRRRQRFDAHAFDVDEGGGRQHQRGEPTQNRSAKHAGRHRLCRILS
jgi:hypothetical protein